MGTNWDAAAATLSLSLYSASSAGGVALVGMATLLVEVRKTKRLMLHALHSIEKQSVLLVNNRVFSKV